MLETFLEAFITLFVVIDPFGITPVFAALTKDESLARKRQIALKATVISTIILLSFAFIGDWLLDHLGISEPSFRIAGGLLLLIAAIDMVVAKPSGISSTTSEEAAEAIEREDVSVFPLAIPLIAGPGGLAAITILMRGAGNDYSMQIGIITVLVVVLAITYVMLLLSGYISRWLGITGLNVFSRVLGIILAALAIQFITDGVRLSFPGFA